MKEARAFCPGHVTGLFEICRKKDLMSTGSRGAGLCLSLGAGSEVSIAPSRTQRIEVEIDGRESEAPVTKEALRRIVGRRLFDIEVTTSLDLPVGQGFGMSAAGALSASVAACSILKESRRRAFEAAHAAEIVKGGGLGDVSALYRGGITIRKKPGLPPIGEVLSIEGCPKVVLCVVGRRMLTKSVLSDPRKQRAINANGARQMDDLLKHPTLEELMAASFRFAAESGLMSSRISEAAAAASKIGLASMSMLGNSVFAVGDSNGLERALSKFGKTYKCEVDSVGPRILQNAIRSSS
jgi:pantoate kinase